MTDVRRIPGTVLRNGIYYLQLRVPSDLVEAFGYRHFKESLRTSDYAEAKREAARRRLACEELIAEKRAELAQAGPPASPASPLKLHAQQARIKEYVATESAKRRVWLSQQRWRLRPGSRDDARREMVAAFGALRDPGDDFTWQRIRDVAVQLFPENRFDQPDLGILHDLRHPINGPMRNTLRRGLLEIERRSIAFLDGDYSGNGGDALFALQPSTNPPPSAVQGETHPQDISLAEASKQRLADHAKGSVRDQRKAQLAAAHRVIIRYFGEDAPLRSITPAQCEQFRDLIAELPRDLTKRFSVDDPLPSIAERGRASGLPTIAKATQETYLGALRDLMSWAKERWLIDRSPADNLRSLAKDNERVRTDFDEDLLRSLFAKPFMTGLDRFLTETKDGKGLSEATRFWIPRIALYTGMRQSEICQLDVADVRMTKSGTHYLLSTDDGDDKQLKNAMSRKAVPIHHALLKAGLLDYVRQCAAAGELKLFPDLVKSDYGHYGSKMSKWFNRQLRQAHYPRGVDFHAFRHTFRQALRHIDAPPEVAARLGGWSTNQGVMERYGGALSERWIDHLNATLQRVSYGQAAALIFEASSPISQTQAEIAS
jgi:integrase